MLRQLDQWARVAAASALGADGTVTCANVVDRVVEMHNAPSFSALGHGPPQSVPYLRWLAALERRIHARLLAALSARAVFTLYEIECELAEEQSVPRFEDLGVGALARHPTARSLLGLPDGLSCTPALTCADVVRAAIATRRTSTGRVVAEDVRAHLARKLGVADPASTCACITNLPLLMASIASAKRGMDDRLARLAEQELERGANAAPAATSSSSGDDSSGDDSSSDDSSSDDSSSDVSSSDDSSSGDENARGESSSVADASGGGGSEAPGTQPAADRGAELRHVQARFSSLGTQWSVEAAREAWTSLARFLAARIGGACFDGPPSREAIARQGLHWGQALHSAEHGPLRQEMERVLSRAPVPVDGAPTAYAAPSDTEVAFSRQWWGADGEGGGAPGGAAALGADPAPWAVAAPALWLAGVRFACPLRGGVFADPSSVRPEAWATAVVGEGREQVLAATRRMWQWELAGLAHAGNRHVLNLPWLSCAWGQRDGYPCPPTCCVRGPHGQAADDGEPEVGGDTDVASLLRGALLPVVESDWDGAATDCGVREAAGPALVEAALVVFAKAPLPREAPLPVRRHWRSLSAAAEDLRAREAAASDASGGRRRRRRRGGRGSDHAFTQARAALAAHLSLAAGAGNAVEEGEEGKSRWRHAVCWLPKLRGRPGESRQLQWWSGAASVWSEEGAPFAGHGVVCAVEAQAAELLPGLSQRAMASLRRRCTTELGCGERAPPRACAALARRVAEFARMQQSLTAAASPGVGTAWPSAHAAASLAPGGAGIASEAEKGEASCPHLCEPEATSWAGTVAQSAARELVRQWMQLLQYAAGGGDPAGAAPLHTALREAEACIPAVPLRTDETPADPTLVWRRVGDPLLFVLPAAGEGEGEGERAMTPLEQYLVEGASWHPAPTTRGTGTPAATDPPARLHPGAAPVAGVLMGAGCRPPCELLTLHATCQGGEGAMDEAAAGAARSLQQHVHAAACAVQVSVSLQVGHGLRVWASAGRWRRTPWPVSSAAVPAPKGGGVTLFVEADCVTRGTALRAAWAAALAASTPAGAAGPEVGEKAAAWELVAACAAACEAGRAVAPLPDAVDEPAQPHTAAAAAGAGEEEGGETSAPSVQEEAVPTPEVLTAPPSKRMRAEQRPASGAAPSAGAAHPAPASLQPADAGWNAQEPSLGRWAEGWVCAALRGQAHGPHAAALRHLYGEYRVRWVNEHAESGAPFDVELVPVSGSEVVQLEVKATSRASKQWFELSPGEVEAAARARARFHVLRVFAQRGQSGSWAPCRLSRVVDLAEWIRSGRATLRCDLSEVEEAIGEPTAS